MGVVLHGAARCATGALRVLVAATVLATATAASAQSSPSVTVANYAALKDLPSSDLVDTLLLLGYRQAGDGGGGVLRKTSPCTPDDAMTFKPTSSSDCYRRVAPITNVRQAGAWCDVRVINSVDQVHYMSADAQGPDRLEVEQTAFKGALPEAGMFIAASQIGGPTVYDAGVSALRALMWATRWSTLSNAGSGYHAGDLVSFVGGDGSTAQAGRFSQQVAILVDAVDASGAITEWHFLHGGLYEVSAAPTLPMSQDPENGHNYTNGVGAAFSPRWSGWSVLDKQKARIIPGSGYAVGEKLYLGAGGGFDYKPRIVVKEVDANGAIIGFEWLDYGLLSAGQALPNTIADASPGGGSGFQIGNNASAEYPVATRVAWTRGTLATTFSATVMAPSGSSAPYIFPLSDGSDASDGTAVAYVYYGHDDGSAINKAPATRR